MSWHWTILLAAAAICSSLTGPASAQEAEIGSRVAQRQQTASGKPVAQSVVDSHLYAECVVHRRSAQSADYLALTDPKGTAAARNNLGREIQCTNSQISSEFGNEQRLNIPTDLYRGMIAEALIESRFARSTPPALPLTRVYVSPWGAVSGRAAAVEDMGICVAATNPAGIRAVLATHPESDEELAALHALSPSMGPCLAANVKLTANRQGIRATLAEALYHRLTSPVPATVPTPEKK
ncbi:hypothetical protein [Sphingomonas bacterium]|uniref:hypothetical protein n=1 Tax=Sphingomonas bacterium TaxID=1895847 RepID=UPI0015753E06|nr:hypothetical protein [Sphingomonas bacterium]